jgi:hypothetical protein
MADAAVPEALAVLTARSALAGPSPAIAALVDGVLAMMARDRVRRLVTAGILLAATGGGLTAGATALLRPSPEPIAAAPVPLSTQDEAASADNPTRLIRGVVVDEGGQAVAGAEVVADFGTPDESRTSTGPDGAFAVPSRRLIADLSAILARSADGTSLGYFDGIHSAARGWPKSPIRIVLRPSRAVQVRVRNAKGQPVPDAGVQAVADYQIVADATTGADGMARLLLPPETRLGWITGMKPGLALDFAEFGAYDEAGHALGPKTPAPDLPEVVDLTLGEQPRTLRIRAVDTSGNPVVNVRFRPWLIDKEGRRSQVSNYSRRLSALTDAEGVAVFDWLPPTRKGLIFWPATEGFAHRRIEPPEGESGIVVAMLMRTATIRGRVTHPDGSPAIGVALRANGSGQGSDEGYGRARTDQDGAYRMDVSPGESYILSVDEEDLVAPSRTVAVVGEGGSTDGVDLRLSPGAILRGLVTSGKANTPVAGQGITLIENAKVSPEVLIAVGDREFRRAQRPVWATTDAAGRYSIRLAPGSYRLFASPRNASELQGITVKDGDDLVRDFHMAEPETGRLTGRVVQNGAEPKGVPGARVTVVGHEVSAISFTVTTDANGRFEVNRRLEAATVHATTDDQALGAIVEISAKDSDLTIVLATTATASGRMLDEHGQIAAHRRLDWGRKVFVDEEPTVWTTHFGGRVETDAEGRFTLTGLVVGQSYGVSFPSDSLFHLVTTVEPRQPGPIDLGTVRAGTLNPEMDRKEPRTK